MVIPTNHRCNLRYEGSVATKAPVQVRVAQVMGLRSSNETWHRDLYQRSKPVADTLDELSGHTASVGGRTFIRADKRTLLGESIPALRQLLQVAHESLNTLE